MQKITEAKKRADKKWNAEKVDPIHLRLPKGKKEILSEYAAKKGESVNSLLNRLIDEELSKQL